MHILILSTRDAHARAYRENGGNFEMLALASTLVDRFMAKLWSREVGTLSKDEVWLISILLGY